MNLCSMMSGKNIRKKTRAGNVLLSDGKYCERVELDMEKLTEKEIETIGNAQDIISDLYTGTGDEKLRELYISLNYILKYRDKK